MARPPRLKLSEVLAEKSLSHVSIHESPADFSKDIAGRIFKGQRVIAWIDAPTSKAKVLADSIKLVEQLNLQHVAVFIPVGRRFDLMAGVMSMVNKSFPKHTAYVVQCEAKSTQNKRTLPTYAVYLPVPGLDTHAVPTSVRVNACRASSVEALRLRCMDRSCPLRPEKPGEGMPPDVHAEICADDLEDQTMDEYCEFMEDTDDAAMEIEEPRGGLTPQVGDPYLVDLFPFARPIRHYKDILIQVCHSDSAAHLVLVSRTGHPGLLVAARDVNLEIFALMHNVKQHGFFGILQNFGLEPRF